jgi:hypothetical protein
MRDVISPKAAYIALPIGGGRRFRRARMPFMIDPIAKDIVLHRAVLPESLHVPIAAVDEAAITTYIGDIVQILAEGTPNRALLVRVNDAPPIDPRLPIWEMAASEIFHHPLQVWVHWKWNCYRQSYRKAFPDEAIHGKVLSHTMNRRIAKLKGFQYVRITVTSRGPNSSSGFSEQWGIQLYDDPKQTAEQRRRGAFIQYADLSELMLMLDMKIGGGVMEAVNVGQALVEPRPVVT